MNWGLIEAVALYAGFNLLLGAVGMYSVYWVQEQYLAAGYLWAAVLAVTVPWIELMYVPWPLIRYTMTIAGLAGVAFVAWGWEPVFTDEEDRNSGFQRIEIESGSQGLEK